MKMSLTLAKKNIIRERLFEKITGKVSPHISIYLPAIDPYYNAIIRKEDFKHQLADAFYYLQKDYPIRDIVEIERAIYASLELDTLNKTNNSIGFFYKEGFIKMLELPIQVSKKVVAANSFHIKPIIEIEQMASSYYYFSLRKDRIDVYEGSPWQINKLRSYSYLDFNLTQKNILEKKDIETFYSQSLNDEILRFTKDKNPIILSGVDYLQQIFQKKTNVDESRIILSKTSGDLKTQIFECLKSYFPRVQKNVLNDFQSYRGTTKLLFRLDDAFKMARKGKISKLLIASDVQQWGQQLNNGEIIQHGRQKNGQDDDLLDDMAEEVLRSGGEVFCLPKHLIPFDYNFTALLK
ncbi:MAG: hypothetical protein ACOYL6_15980 [Bacteriovoracaceae bacterium]